MSRHEGVSCDSCNKSNFRGKRYKCLICFDYDLCAKCYDNGTTTTRHTINHPMQCILTRLDFDLFYGGETIQFDQPQSFVCPYCGKMGLTESQLQEHVTGQHSASSIEVICPVCAALPGGDPHHVTDDLGGHLTLEHRALRDVQDEPLRRNIRRIFHPPRTAVPIRRRGYPQFTSTTSSTSTNSSTATFSSARENIDPIAELLSQLSGVRRAAQQQSAAATASQLQLLQQQLQFERQQMQQARERLERLPRKQAVPTSLASTSTGNKEPTKDEKDQFLLPQVFDDFLSNNVAKQEKSKYSDFTRELFYSLTASHLETELPEPTLSEREGIMPSTSVDRTVANLEDLDFESCPSTSACSTHDVDSSENLLLCKTRNNVEGDDSFCENSEGSN